MQANLEAANTDKQALENSKAGTARTHATALEQLEGAQRSSAAQITDLTVERDSLRVQVADVTAQSAGFKTQGGALLAASCAGLVPFIGICARFALQPRRRRQSCKSRRARSHRRRSCLPSALRGWRLSSSCAAQRRRARTRLWRKSHNWSRRRL